jgi:hypothetical protein
MPRKKKYYSRCKECNTFKRCMSETTKICSNCYTKTNPRQYLINKYTGIKQRCTNPNHRNYCRYKGMLKITKNEFLNIFLNDPNYCKLHKKWIQAGTPKDLTPSIDRINTEKGYVSGNLRMVPLWVNNYYRMICQLGQDHWSIDPYRLEKIKKYGHPGDALTP